MEDAGHWPHELVPRRPSGKCASRVGSAETNGETPIHNHPFDFISTIIVGEMINTRYEESPGGFEYNRFRLLRS